MAAVREASIEWVSLAIQKEDPSERDPRQLAEQLVEIAEARDVPIERLVQWVHMQHNSGYISPREFAGMVQETNLPAIQEEQRC